MIMGKGYFWGGAAKGVDKALDNKLEAETGLANRQLAREKNAWDMLSSDYDRQSREKVAAAGHRASATEGGMGVFGSMYASNQREIGNLEDSMANDFNPNPQQRAAQRARC